VERATLAHRHVHDRRQPGGDGHHLLRHAAAYTPSTTTRSSPAPPGGCRRPTSHGAVAAPTGGTDDTRRHRGHRLQPRQHHRDGRRWRHKLTPPRRGGRAGARWWGPAGQRSQLHLRQPVLGRHQSGAIWISTTAATAGPSSRSRTAALGAIDFPPATAGWAVGRGTVDATTNGGATWMRSSSTAQALDGVSCVSATSAGSSGQTASSRRPPTAAPPDGGDLRYHPAARRRELRLDHPLAGRWATRASSWATANGAPPGPRRRAASAGISPGQLRQCQRRLVPWVRRGAAVTVNGGTTWAQTPEPARASDAVSMVSAPRLGGSGGRDHPRHHQWRQHWTQQGAGIQPAIMPISAVNASDAMGRTLSGRRTGHPGHHQRGASWVCPQPVRAVDLHPIVATGAARRLGVVTLVSTKQPVPQLDRPDLSAGLGKRGTPDPFVIANPTASLVTQTVAVGSVIAAQARSRG